ncbi:MAG: bifunctional demethylmenaquinone methyltransferase/2-methoxy-6-polyprenyl-1,4-benzoquinol methylase UbiE [Planctomycetia bacterium]|nr:bifunctional demethylmenaquinone methyltransferase/2-methoxy-6-polyprenyl-1,4-benzoquinol methylase UbiE [Planctomycetia bacterium]
MAKSPLKMKVDKTPQRIQRMFGQIAPKYDFLNHFLSLGIDYSWRRKTVKRVLSQLKTDPKGFDLPILDVATGTGDLAIEFVRQIERAERVKRTQQSSKIRVLGVDFSKPMLKIAQQKLEKKGLESQIQLMFGDGLALPFDADSFAAVSMAFGLRNMSDIDLAITEMIRVCRPNGKIAILEFTMPTFPIFSALYRFYFRTFLPKFGEFIARNKDSAYQYLPQSISEFDSQEKIKSRLEKAGLINVQSYSMTLGTVALYLAEKKS